MCTTSTHHLPFDDDWLWVQPGSPKVHHHLPGLGGVKKQVVGVTGCVKHPQVGVEWEEMFIIEKERERDVELCNGVIDVDDGPEMINEMINQLHN